MFFPEKDFIKLSPESQGVKSEAIISAINAIRASGKDIHSMLIVKNGALISETYFAPNSARVKHAMYSCSKTFTSMLIGIAQGKGLISLSDKVASFFPDKLPENPSENLLAMTIRDLLFMASGNDQDTFPFMSKTKEDWVKVFLSRPVEHTPGTFFRYNTGATYMLSAILTKVTGKTALELAKEWIFEKIGIKFAKWDASPQGISMGGTGLRITPPQMSRFGLLLLNEGNWNGEQVIPREYVLEAREKKIDTSNHIAHPDWCAGYCYQMWRCSFGAYRADGMGGQFITVLPEQNAVVVFTSALASDIVYPMDLVSEYLVEALRGNEPVAENPAAYEQLCALSAECAHPSAGKLPAEAEKAVPWGRKIALENKLLNLVNAFTIFDGRIVIHTDLGNVTFGYQWNAPVLSFADFQLPFLREPVQLSFMGGWMDGALTMRIAVLGEPMTAYLRLMFSGENADISVHTTMLGDLHLQAKVEG